jgi:rod shape determining protein RodA
MIDYVGNNYQSRGLSNLLHIDLKLFLAIIAITILGLLTIYSSSSGDMSLVIKQFTRIAIGIITMVFIAQVHPDNLRLFAPPLYFFTVVLLIMVLFFGVGNTADRWLDLYFIRFQPSELMKIFVPLMVASYYSDKPLPPKFTYILVASIVVLAPVLMIMKQPDLGTALLIAMSGAIAILLAGISIRFFVSSLIIIISLVPVLWMNMPSSA